MNYIEAAEINAPRILNAMEFMLKMSTKGIHLDSIGFVLERFENFNGQQLTQRIFDEDDNSRVYVKTDYIYKAQPIIKTIFSGQAPPMAYVGTRYHGPIRGFKANLLSFDYRTKEFALKIEDHSNPILTITHKVEPGNLYTDHINDIHDEAELFQYSLTCTEIPDIVFDSAKRLMQLIQISPQVDAIDLRMTPVIVDLEYKDLEAEFNRKQQGFCNF